MTAIVLHKVPRDAFIRLVTCLVRKQKVHPAEPESKVFLIIFGCGLMTVQRISKAKPTQWARLGRLVHNVHTNISICTFVMKIFKFILLVYRQSCIAIGIEALERITATYFKRQIETDHWAEWCLLQGDIWSLETIDHCNENEHYKRVVHDWRKCVKMKWNLEAQSDKLVKMPSKFESMSDAGLVCIRVTEHRTKQTSGKTQPVHCFLHKTAPVAREYDKVEIHSLLNTGAIKQLERKWAFTLQ